MVTDKFLDAEMVLSEMQRDTGKTLAKIAPHVSKETESKLRELHRLTNEARQLIVREAVAAAA